MVEFGFNREHQALKLQNSLLLLFYLSKNFVYFIMLVSNKNEMPQIFNLRDFYGKFGDLFTISIYILNVTQLNETQDL